MKTTTIDSITYREPSLERAITSILSRDEEREKFLRDREKYVAGLPLSTAAKTILLDLSDELVNDTAAEFADGFATHTPVEAQFDPLTAPCFIITAPSNNCDG